MGVIYLNGIAYGKGSGSGGGGTADFPEGGTTGQALVKASNADNDVEWGTINSIPEGGTTGQVLAKHSATDKDVEWKTIDADKTQYTTMPTASADNLGQIVQYVGETTVTEPIYIKGLFYQCVSDYEATSDWWLILCNRTSIIFSTPYNQSGFTIYFTLRYTKTTD